MQSKTKLVTTVVTIIVIAGIVLLADHLKSSSTAASTDLASNTSRVATTPTTSSSTADTSATTSTTSTNASSYKDGTYTASSDYYVPHGTEDIKVTLTIKDGVVTDSSIVNSESDHDSATFQEEFASAYKSRVVGQKIAGLQLGSISGASDTTEGFNNAVNQIQSQAQA
jgi:uncharacterized protein with FMN-binding domain